MEILIFSHAIGHGVFDWFLQGLNPNICYNDEVTVS